MKGDDREPMDSTTKLVMSSVPGSEVVNFVLIVCRYNHID